MARSSSGRMPASHAGDRGSTPLRATKFDPVRPSMCYGIRPYDNVSYIRCRMPA